MAYKRSYHWSRKLALTLLMLVVFSAGLMAHQFYLSITTLQHHPESQKLTLSVKLFLNDLEEAIYQQEGVRLGLWRDAPIDGALDHVARYVRANLSIRINGAPVSLKYIDEQMEAAEVIEDNVIICQLEVEDIPEITTITVHNSLLIEAFDSQTNLVKVRANGTRKSLNLDKRLPEGELSFD
ncbi:DUF6702 family protein [Reichenbachiella ulvae]|uniref:Uncharacterized protein n=1 Tax=Reichenbachiella ulvae TaxID=2980104 RepID=A0ABT3CU89_9BACT|nr:DUF6702 family protein [Reichenbachiella ulvae]MCV9387045.1 hypothetical protein [Reichenbachiella ulvae]